MENSLITATGNARAMIQFLNNHVGELYERITGTKPQLKHKYQCILPDHTDNTPSMVYYGNRFYCFGCHRTIDFFTLLSLYHNIPIDFSEESFYKKILPKLVKAYEEFGGDLSAVDIEADAVGLKNAAIINRVIDYFNEFSEPYLEWLSPQLHKEYEIGVLRNTADLEDRLMLEFTITLKYLKEEIIPIHRLFGESKLTFILRDAYGNPTAIMARNLDYEKRLLAHEEYMASIPASYEPSPKPIKYYTYELPGNKSIIGWGFDRIDYKDKHVVLVESVKAASFFKSIGINAIAANTSNVSNKLLDFLVSRNLEVILMLDNDEAGRLGTFKFLQRMGKTGKKVPTKVFDYEDLALEEKENLADYLIRTGAQINMKALLQSSKDIFDWALNYDYDVAEKYESLILYISLNYYKALRTPYISAVANAFNTSREAVEADVEKEVKLRDNRKIKRMLNDVKYRADKLLACLDDEKSRIFLEKELETIKDRLDIVDDSVNTFSQTDIHDKVNEIITANETLNDESLIGWKTGMHFFDESMEGLPRSESTIVVGGGFNLGKSSFVINLTCNMLQHEENEDLYVGFITNDDSMRKVIPKFLANLSGLNITWCKHPKKFLTKAEEVDQYMRAKQTLLEWTEPSSPKLGIYDVKDIQTYDQCIDFVKSIQDRFQKQVVLIIDNFHMILVPHQDQTRGREELVTKFHNSTIDLQYTLILTAELRKLNSTNPKARPTAEDLKDTIRLGYVPTIIGLLWSSEWAYGRNGERAPRGESVMWWHEPNGTKVPILEWYIDKNKADMVDQNANKTTLYFKAYNWKATYEEVTLEEIKANNNSYGGVVVRKQIIEEERSERLSVIRRGV